MASYGMNRKRNVVLGLTVLFCLITAKAPFPQEESFSIPFSTMRLKNGLTVILSDEDSLPLVSVVVAYRVGSIHDLPGKPGMAHLMEDLMFQGSRNVGQMQHINYLNKIGGEFNVETQEDKTVFSQTVPSNQLALVLWLESDRMNSLSVTETSVDEAKERLMGYIQALNRADPYRESALLFDRLLFSDNAYSHPVIGTNNEEVENITLEDMLEFHAAYFNPANAVLCISGDIHLERTIELVRRYFESIPPGNPTPPLEIKAPEQAENIEQSIEESLASLPGFYLGYRVASPYSDDFYALGIIEYILMHGKSSRLYKRLLRETQRIAFQVNGVIDRRKDAAAMKIFLLAINSVMKDRCRRILTTEINRLRTSLVPEKELIRAKNIFKADYIKQFETTLGTATYLAESYIDRDGLDGLDKELSEFMSVSPGKIIGVMNRYFTTGSVFLDIEIR